MAAAQAGARLGGFAVEALGGAGIGNLGGAVGTARLDRFQPRHPGGVEAGVEDAGRAGDQPGLAGAALGAPLRSAAGKDAHVLRAHGFEGPPDARRRKQAYLVIDHDGHVLGNAQRAHHMGEIIGRGQHMGQIGRGIGDAVDIEEDRAGDMAGEIFGLRVAAGTGHVPAGIDHDQIGIAQMLGQPLRGDEGVFHGREPSTEPGRLARAMRGQGSAGFLASSPSPGLSG